MTTKFNITNAPTKSEDDHEVDLWLEPFGECGAIALVGRNKPYGHPKNILLIHPNGRLSRIMNANVEGLDCNGFGQIIITNPTP